MKTVIKVCLILNIVAGTVCLIASDVYGVVVNYGFAVFNAYLIGE